MLLRREQYRRADAPTASCVIARAIVVGKSLNQRAVIRRALRDHASRYATVRTALQLAAIQTSKDQAQLNLCVARAKHEEAAAGTLRQKTPEESCANLLPGAQAATAPVFNVLVDNGRRAVDGGN